MKKILKRIFLILLLIITFSITNVMAEGGKTIIIELPSTEFTDLQTPIYKMTIRDMLALQTVTEDNTDPDGKYIYNQEGKPIITLHTNPFYYELLDGVTEEDCTFMITEEMRNILKASQLDGVLDGYDKIKIVLEEFEPHSFDKYVINVPQDDKYDLNYIDGALLYLLIQDFNIDNMSYKYTIKNLEGKDLAYLTGIFSDAEVMDSISSTIAEGVTEEDDIILELTNEERTNLTNYFSRTTVSFNVDNYSRLVVRFSDKEYLDSDYVVDVKSINRDNYVKDGNVLTYIADSKGLIRENIDYYIKNDKNEIVVECGRLFDYYITAISSPNATYMDNIVVNLKNNSITSLEEAFGEYDYSQMVLKLKDPEFIKGANQVYNNKDDISFVLSISKEELDNNGSIYIDNKLVDNSNYTLNTDVKGVTLTLKKEYLNTLSNGAHEIKAVALYGETISSFTINNIKNPNTGNKILMIISLMIISILFGTILYKKRIKY